MSLALCENKNCEEYKNKTCKRAVRYQNIIKDGWKGYINMIPKRDNKQACDLFINVELR